MPRRNAPKVNLSAEQQEFIDSALAGKNVLVDACIGSGKTTTIQRLCNELPKNKKILYLTYNKLLKKDAIAKIKNKNATVTNYHGFAYRILANEGVSVGQAELIQAFLQLQPVISRYDVLILDEYQDINQEISEELEYIKKQCPGLQIIAVGDIKQKIYDYTTLTDISRFIREFLGDHIEMKFSKCFRLSKEYAAQLGDAWGKDIEGTNEDFSIERMSFEDAVELMGDCDPGDVLCLGSAQNNGTRAKFQNEIENRFYFKYNKKTLWSSIKDQGDGGSTSPLPGSAIFTTFDGSKGMERPICFICDYDKDYWEVRSRVPHQKHEVLQNIFLVAASRGKNRVIFVEKPKGGKQYNTEMRLSPTDTAKPFETNHTYRDPVDISSMFDFKYKEDVESCYDLIEITQLRESASVIKTPMSDHLIDLSPCIGEYVEASYFSAYDAESQMNFLRSIYKNRSIAFGGSDRQKHILQIAAQGTGQYRYLTQVDIPFVSKDATARIHERLSKVFLKSEEVQVEGEINLSSEKDGKADLCMKGRCDVLKDDVVYEIKFVQDLQHTHFLQLACYLVMLGKRQGCLWNVRNGEMYEITIPDRIAFMDQVARTVTKRDFKAYYVPKNQNPIVEPSMPLKKLPHIEKKISIVETLSTDNNKPARKIESVVMPGEERYFAVIDTETNQSYNRTYRGRIEDGPVMSIGVVIAEIKTFKPVSRYYGIVEDEAEKRAWEPAKKALRITKIDNEACREEILEDVKTGLARFGVTKIAAYNAKFDYDHLPELHDDFDWIDIMGPCQYRQYNPYLPYYLKTFKTGKVQRGYKVDDILKHIEGKKRTSETHNALLDACDELSILQALGSPLCLYEEFGLYNRSRLIRTAPTEYDLKQARALEISLMLENLSDERISRVCRDPALSKPGTRSLLYGCVEDVRPDKYYGKYASFTLQTRFGAYSIGSIKGGAVLSDGQVIVVIGNCNEAREVTRPVMFRPEDVSARLAG